MNGRILTHVLLLLAMLVSQMATNAHMINHMHVAVIECNLPVSHAHGHYHDGSNLDHSGSNSEKSSPDDAKSDCSIFHAYAGTNGITPAQSSSANFNPKNHLVKPFLHISLSARTSLAHPIRGPPLYS